MSDTRTPNKLPFKQSLFLGLYGNEVQVMKMWLNELNDYYHFSNKATIRETNYFNFETVHFIRDFQRFCGIPPTGAYDAVTHDKVEWKSFEITDQIRISANIPLVKSPKPIDQKALDLQRKADKVMGTSRKW